MEDAMTMDVKYINPFIAAAKNVFKTMLDMDLMWQPYLKM